MVNRPFCGPVAVRMLELQPGMVSKICESFKVPSHGCGTFSDAQIEDQPLTWMAESDNRLEKSVSAHGGTFVQDPTAIRVDPINDILPRDRQREPTAQGLIATTALGLIANATNGITKDMATREIVCWSMVDHPGATPAIRAERGRDVQCRTLCLQAGAEVADRRRQ